jgi:tRNA (adenine57-N1/adenine58-N1)-methyltransferase
MIEEGDAALLVFGKTSFFVIIERKEFHTHFGKLDLGEVIGKEYGVKVASHSGSEFRVLRPNFIDYIKKMRKMPQIILPKDACQIIAHTGLAPGWNVVEAGAGSAALTIFLATMVCPGRVYSYEVNPKFASVAQKNIEGMGLKNVELKMKDIYEGIDEKDVDLVCLDLAEPERVCSHAWEALLFGGYVFSYSPTIDQTMKFTAEAKKCGFSVKTIECLVREYEDEKGMRPKTVMLGHTGYMTFGRKV